MSIINGSQALMEGFGEDPPPQDVAQNRADICTGRVSSVPCAYNHQGTFSLTSKIAAFIHAQRQRKLELKLSVDGEGSLGICKVCKCYLPLKVWYSSRVIYEYTEDSTIAKFPDFCWIKRELEQLNQKPQP